MIDTPKRDPRYRPFLPPREMKHGPYSTYTVLAAIKQRLPELPEGIGKRALVAMVRVRFGRL